MRSGSCFSRATSRRQRVPHQAAGASASSTRNFLKVLETERETIGVKQPVVFLDPPWGRVHYKKHVRPCLRVYASICVCA